MLKPEIGILAEDMKNWGNAFDESARGVLSISKS